MDKEKRFKMAVDNFVTELANYANIDINDSNIVDTSKRIYDMYKEELLEGYNKSPKEYIKLFESDIDYNEPIVISNIPVKSLCIHHLLPFYGTAKITIKYNKNAKILGLSKYYRIVDNFSRKLQLQESLTKEIMIFLKDNLDVSYVKVELECHHACVGIRGVNNIDNTTYSVSEYKTEK